MKTVLNWLQRLVEGAWFLFLARWSFFTFAKVAYGLRVYDAERVPREGGLVVAINHRSSLDPPVVGVSVPREMHFMAKKELFEKPASRLLMRGLRAFPVDRQRNDVGAIKEAMRRVRQGIAIGIFAQGTRNAGDAEALDGAAFLAQRAGVPLLPAAVWREGRAFRVRFGEPFTIEDRSREAIGRATRETMRRIDALMPGDRSFRDSTGESAPPVGEPEGSEPAPEAGPAAEDEARKPVENA